MLTWRMHSPPRRQVHIYIHIYGRLQWRSCSFLFPNKAILARKWAAIRRKPLIPSNRAWDSLPC